MKKWQLSRSCGFVRVVSDGPNPVDGCVDVLLVVCLMFPPFYRVPLVFFGWIWTWCSEYGHVEKELGWGEMSLHLKKLKKKISIDVWGQLAPEQNLKGKKR